ncbi:tyrosine-type recombinase/integrase [Enterococcus rivorum]|uniref:tyrosine-type recombinase/integrase n=1 Tax=Enterococcus rivorum TaxID=762845 RepID=UPI000A01F669|nr:tyrosine-type recombinase/integrase [Enterococcus rivorum]MBP2100590.1 site-specific recombinase XerD [Enterococcus rivorum]
MRRFFYFSHLTMEEINRTINTVAKKMKLRKHITSHKFRHTHVRLLSQAGVSLEVIQERIGHGDERVTK